MEGRKGENGRDLRVIDLKGEVEMSDENEEESIESNRKCGGK